MRNFELSRAYLKKLMVCDVATRTVEPVNTNADDVICLRQECHTFPVFGYFFGSSFTLIVFGTLRARHKPLRELEA